LKKHVLEKLGTDLHEDQLTEYQTYAMSVPLTLSKTTKKIMTKMTDAMINSIIETKVAGEKEKDIMRLINNIKNENVKFNTKNSKQETLVDLALKHKKYENLAFILKDEQCRQKFLKVASNSDKIKTHLKGLVREGNTEKIQAFLEHLKPNLWNSVQKIPEEIVGSTEDYEILKLLIAEGFPVPAETANRIEKELAQILETAKEYTDEIAKIHACYTGDYTYENIGAKLQALFQEALEIDELKKAFLLYNQYPGVLTIKISDATRECIPTTSNKKLLKTRYKVALEKHDLDMLKFISIKLWPDILKENDIIQSGNLAFNEHQPTPNNELLQYLFDCKLNINLEMGEELPHLLHIVAQRKPLDKELFQQVIGYYSIDGDTAPAFQQIQIIEGPEHIEQKDILQTAIESNNLEAVEMLIDNLPKEKTVKILKIEKIVCENPMDAYNKRNEKMQSGVKNTVYLFSLKATKDNITSAFIYNKQKKILPFDKKIKWDGKNENKIKNVVLNSIQSGSAEETDPLNTPITTHTPLYYATRNCMRNPENEAAKNIFNTLKDAGAELAEAETAEVLFAQTANFEEALTLTKLFPLWEYEYEMLIKQAQRHNAGDALSKLAQNDEELQDALKEALFSAVEENKTETVQFLLDGPFNDIEDITTIKDKNGNTLLHKSPSQEMTNTLSAAFPFSLTTEHFKILKLLKEKGHSLPDRIQQTIAIYLAEELENALSYDDEVALLHDLYIEGYLEEEEENKIEHGLERLFQKAFKRYEHEPGKAFLLYNRYPKVLTDEILNGISETTLTNKNMRILKEQYKTAWENRDPKMIKLIYTKLWPGIENEKDLEVDLSKYDDPESLLANTSSFNDVLFLLERFPHWEKKKEDRKILLKYAREYGKIEALLEFDSIFQQDLKKELSEPAEKLFSAVEENNIVAVSSTLDDLELRFGKSLIKAVVNSKGDNPLHLSSSEYMTIFLLSKYPSWANKTNNDKRTPLDKWFLIAEAQLKLAETLAKSSSDNDISSAAGKIKRLDETYYEKHIDPILSKTTDGTRIFYHLDSRKKEDAKRIYKKQADFLENIELLLNEKKGLTLDEKISGQMFLDTMIEDKNWRKNDNPFTAVKTMSDRIKKWKEQGININEELYQGAAFSVLQPVITTLELDSEKDEKELLKLVGLVENYPTEEVLFHYYMGETESIKLNTEIKHLDVQTTSHLSMHSKRVYKHLNDKTLSTEKKRQSLKKLKSTIDYFNNEDNKKNIKEYFTLLEKLKNSGARKIAEKLEGNMLRKYILEMAHGTLYQNDLDALQQEQQEAIKEVTVFNKINVKNFFRIVGTLANSIKKLIGKSNEDDITPETLHRLRKLDEKFSAFTKKAKDKVALPKDRIREARRQSRLWNRY